jgi:predicted helicase
VEATFFTGATKRETLGRIKHYYECIKAQATSIVSHREKQTFLKVIYENFYRAYNPKGADRLGIVYTPGEIIDFMIRSTDTLLHRHFGKGLADKGVEILDPRHRHRQLRVRPHRIPPARQPRLQIQARAARQ